MKKIESKIIIAILVVVGGISIIAVYANTSNPFTVPYQLIDSNGNVVRMTVDGTGRVGIGTTSPVGSLHISNPGNEWTTWNWNSALMVDANSVTHTAIGIRSGTNIWAIAPQYNSYNLDFAAMPNWGSNNGSPTVMMVINNSTGNVGIGTQTPAQKLAVSGNIGLSGNIVPSNNNPICIGTGC